MSRWTLAKKFWVREIRSVSFPCLLFWQCKLWFCSDVQIPRGVEWKNGDLRSFCEVLEEQWKMWCENGKVRGKKKEQNLKRIILQLENLTAHANSLPAYYQYTLKLKKKKAVTIMKWSMSKPDIVFQHISSIPFPVSRFFLPTLCLPYKMFSSE